MRKKRQLLSASSKVSCSLLLKQNLKILKTTLARVALTSNNNTLSFTANMPTNV